jgi:RNA polymerase sigma-70 factor (ECF subfamily)
MENEPPMHPQDTTRDFETIALPHLDAAYNLARWLTRNDQDAEDLVQAAYVRAFRFFATFRGDDARAWLLTIVRNTHFTQLRDSWESRNSLPFDEELHADGAALEQQSPEGALLQRDTQAAVNHALERLPTAFREVVVLKDMNDFSYKEIAEIVGVPIGTVMSRLARGRKLLLAYLDGYAPGG